MLYLLAVLPGCRHKEDHTHPDKPGVLQGMRNMHACMPGKSHNYGVKKKEAVFW